jgi:hypothetical protein
MNADKTDISNTNRSRNQTPDIILPEENQLESQSAGDLHAKSKDLREAKDQRCQESTKSLSDGSTIIPTREQKVTTGRNSHKDQTVGEEEKSRDFCRGFQYQLGNKSSLQRKHIRK